MREPDPQMSSDHPLLRVQSTQQGDALVIALAGELDLASAQFVDDELARAQESYPVVILDLTDLGHMDSSGLGTLVALYISAKGANCQLQLVNLSPRIRELLSLTNVLSVFEAYGRCGTRIP